MGYKISIAINCEKAVDWSNVAGVNLLVYHEGESFSILTLTTDEHGYTFGSVDRAHWTETEVKRLKVYATKSGYINTVAKASLDGSFIDPNNTKNYSFFVTILLDTAEPEELPPPTVVVTPITP